MFETPKVTTSEKNNDSTEVGFHQIQLQITILKLK